VNPRERLVASENKSHPVLVHDVIGDVPPGPQVRGAPHKLQELLHLRVGQVKRDAYGSGPVLRQHFQKRYPVDAALSDQSNVRGRVHVVLVLQQEGMRAIEDRGALLELSTRAGLVVLKTRALREICAHDAR